MADEPAVGLSEPMERRSALRWLMRGFLSLWGFGAAALGISYLKAPGTEGRQREGLVRCGVFSAMGVGEARFIRHGTEPFFVLRASESQVLALSAICTHRRCVLNWDPPTRSFLCPCHAGAFDANGNVLFGPPTQPLDRLPAEIRADEVVVRA